VHYFSFSACEARILVVQESLVKVVSLGSLGECLSSYLTKSTMKYHVRQIMCDTMLLLVLEKPILLHRYPMILLLVLVPWTILTFLPTLKSIEWQVSLRNF